MIRSGRALGSDRKGPSERPLTCWGENPVCDAIAFEPADGRVFVFPKAQLVCVEYTGPAPVEVLILTFSIREVRVSGHGLRGMLDAIQTGTLSWVKCFSTSVSSLLSPEGGCVTELKVLNPDTPPDSGGLRGGSESGGE
jgi:hypothetical protein